jgi:hypothetical protein
LLVEGAAVLMFKVMAQEMVELAEEAEAVAMLALLELVEAQH